MRRAGPTRYAHFWRWRIPANFEQHRARRHPGDRPSPVFLQGIVPRQDVRVILAKMPGELFGYVHRAVLPAGTTDGNRQVAAIRLREFADALLQEPGEVGDHGAHAGIPGQVFDNWRVAPVEVTQRMLPVGIREAALIEDVIRIARNAVLVAERLEHEREPALAPAVDALANQLAQAVDPHVRSVDHQVRRRGYRFQE